MATSSTKSYDNMDRRKRSRKNNKGGMTKPTAATDAHPTKLSTLTKPGTMTEMETHRRAMPIRTKT